MITKSRKILISKYTVSMSTSRTQRDSIKIIKLKLITLDTMLPNDLGETGPGLAVVLPSSK